MPVTNPTLVRKTFLFIFCSLLGVRLIVFAFAFCFQEFGLLNGKVFDHDQTEMRMADSEAGRPFKRGRKSDDSFFSQTATSHSGSYLKIALKSGSSIKSKGWPWVQLGIRGVLGGHEKVDKASLLADGSLLVKTKTHVQTEKLLKAKKFGGEACDVVRDSKLNMSRGTIHAYDLIDLTDTEIVG